MKHKEEKKFGPKLDATTSTLPGPLSPGTMYPLNPPLVGPARNPKIFNAAHSQNSFKNQEAKIWNFIEIEIRQLTFHKIKIEYKKKLLESYR